jgi:hypothetical protein
MSLGRVVVYTTMALAGVWVMSIIAAIIFMWPWLRSPPTHRFPMPVGTAFTEAIAIDASKMALANEGYDVSPMLPVPCDKEGHYFAVNAQDANSGCVSWCTPQGSYRVRVQKEGQEIVCEVYRLK